MRMLRAAITPVLVAGIGWSLWLNAASASQRDALAGTSWSSYGAGLEHSCGVAADSSLWCWGFNQSGALGTGDTRSKNHPTRVGRGTAWRLAAAGADHSCAIKSNETLWCWGDNQYGQLGDGRRGFDSNVPVQVTGSKYHWATVSVGDLYTCATDTRNRLWCWGHDQDSVLGDDQNQSQASPKLIGAEREWAQVATNAIGLHTCAVKLDATLWCWGLNQHGQLGTGNTRRYGHPTRVGHDTDWASVSVSGDMSCATKTSGSLWCWGSAQDGELGTGDTEDQLVPKQVGASTTWATVDVGYKHSCATQVDGSLWCWGFNWDGELGDGTTVSRTTPVQVGDPSGWALPSLGKEYSCATRSDATLWCWGDNRYGQLGLGEFGGQALVPTEVP